MKRRDFLKILGIAGVITPIAPSILIGKEYDEPTKHIELPPNDPILFGTDDGRWFAELENEVWRIGQITRPALKVDWDIPFHNEIMWGVPKMEWESIKIEFIDIIGSSKGKELTEWFDIYNIYYNLTGRMGWETYRRDIRLFKVNPVGDILEKIQINGALIETIEYHDYNNTNIQGPAYTVTIKPYKLISNSV